MAIQWFPGHMTKALRMMNVEAKLCDIFVYVLDSRAPQSSVNPEFVKLIGGKPIIFVLNKQNLADNAMTEKWRKHFASMPNSTAVSMNATESNTSKVIVNAINKMLIDKLNSNEQKGVKFIFRAMVIGVPNCGKSTIINNLCGKARAKTGDMPGVTRAKQWIKLTPWLEVMDSPGTLWPSFESEEVALHLAFIGSIKDDIMDIEKLTLELIKYMRVNAPKQLQDKYSLKTLDDKTDIEVYDDIARARGCILKKDEMDYARTAKLVLGDFRKGAIGKITLDSWEDD